jgi:hypothetical protein
MAVCAIAGLVGVVTVSLDFMLVRFLCEGENSLLLGARLRSLSD